MQPLFLFCLFVYYLTAWAHAQSQLVYSSLAYNFTFTAINVTLHNANSSGAPLVLGQNGASAGISFYVTSTYSSFPYNDYPSLGLINNTLRAYQSSGLWATNATAVESGGLLGWVTSTLYTSPAAQIFSVIQSPAYEYPVLAAYGVLSLWSLCPFLGFLGQSNVIFNISAVIPSPPRLGFDPALCYAVMIHVIPLT